MRQASIKGGDGGRLGLLAMLLTASAACSSAPPTPVSAAEAFQRIQARIEKAKSLVFSFIPLIMFIGISNGLVFSYGVAKESRSRWVRLSGFLLAAGMPVVGMIGLLLRSQGWADSLKGVAWTSVAILASGFCFCVVRESKSRVVRTPGLILAATGLSLVLVGWMSYACAV